ncbi:hypothetical protein [Rhodoplanes sp. TEM]|nr:hypothetical protein [Rhodoplanes sp. TEM]
MRRMGQGRSIRGLDVAAAAACVVAIAAVAAPAVAQEGCCAGGPVVVYGAAPVPPVVPPTGYLLDPSDARPPMYVVDQGPLYRGPGIYAVPTYSEGGYAWSLRYPYTYGPVHRAYRRPYYGPRRYGYVGPGDIGPSPRVAGAPPFGAYEVRPAPKAKVIDVQKVARAEVVDGPAATGTVAPKPGTEPRRRGQR